MQCTKHNLSFFHSPSKSPRQTTLLIKITFSFYADVVWRTNLLDQSEDLFFSSIVTVLVLKAETCSLLDSSSIFHFPLVDLRRQQESEPVHKIPFFTFLRNWTGLEQYYTSFPERFGTGRCNFVCFHYKSGPYHTNPGPPSVVDTWGSGRVWLGELVASHNTLQWLGDRKSSLLAISVKVWPWNFWFEAWHLTKNPGLVVNWKWWSRCFCSRSLQEPPPPIHWGKSSGQLPNTDYERKSTELIVFQRTCTIWECSISHKQM